MRHEGDVVKRGAEKETKKVEDKNKEGIDGGDFDSLPISEGKDDSIREGTFFCKSHEVREVIKKATGVSAGMKLFLKGTIVETGDEVEISQAICAGKFGVVREAGLWVKQVAGKLRIGTTVSMLTFYNLPNIGVVDGKEFKAVKNPQGYWIVSAS